MLLPYHLAIGAAPDIGIEKRALWCAGKCQLSACLYSLLLEEVMRVFQTVPVGGQVSQRKLCLLFSSICVAAYHLAIGATPGIGIEKRAL